MKKIIKLKELKEMIDQATLEKVNDHYNADYEGFVDKEKLLKLLEEA